VLNKFNNNKTRYFTHKQDVSGYTDSAHNAKFGRLLGVTTAKIIQPK